jgi:hypothetical protein
MLAFVGNDSGLVDVGLVQGAAGFGSVQKEDSVYGSEITESASSLESGYCRSPLIVNSVKPSFGSFQQLALP